MLGIQDSAGNFDDECGVYLIVVIGPHVPKFCKNNGHGFFCGIQYVITGNLTHLIIMSASQLYMYSTCGESSFSTVVFHPIVSIPQWVWWPEWAYEFLMSKSLALVGCSYCTSWLSWYMLYVEAVQCKPICNFSAPVYQSFICFSAVYYYLKTLKFNDTFHPISITQSINRQYWYWCGRPKQCTGIYTGNIVYTCLRIGSMLHHGKSISIFDLAGKFRIRTSDVVNVFCCV